MNRVAVFGGTTEGRRLALHLAGCGARVKLFVATGYGQELVGAQPGLAIAAGRLDAGEMAEQLRVFGSRLVVDATHPFAQQAGENIRHACAATGVQYLRLAREDGDPAAGEYLVDTVAQAAALLDTLPGKALLAVGSKELEAFTAVKNWQDRLFARVLPSPEVVQKCTALGFRGRNLICMQGPFSREMNTAMLRAVGADILVTKESGDVGGFGEKQAAAQQAGAALVVVRRPGQRQGIGYAALLRLLQQTLQLSPPAAEETAAVFPRFPLFVPLAGRAVLVVGGGAVATRRIPVLLRFGAAVTVASVQLSPALRELVQAGRITWLPGEYAGGDLPAGCALVVAATDKRGVNRRVGQQARRAGVPVSVADSPEESSFWFPAVVQGKTAVAGIVSVDGDHRAVREMARKIRGQMEDGI